MTHVSAGVLRPDVAIVGGGISGSSLGAALAQAGLDVVILERDAEFRDRVRGEGIHPWGVTEAERLGLLAVLREAGTNPLSAMVTYANRTIATTTRWADVEAGCLGEWAISHPSMQSALLQNAVAAGAKVLRPARAVDCSRASSGGWELTAVTDASEVTLRPRLVVGADGRQSVVRRWLGGDVVHDPLHHYVGGCLLDGVLLADDALHVAGFTGGEVLVFPRGQARARVYVICKDDVRQRLNTPNDATGVIGQCAASFPDGAFEYARKAGPLAFFPNADVWATRLAGDGMVLIGDAAGANDPTLGHGLSIGLHDARLLRDQLLQQNDWSIAAARYARARATYFEVLRLHAQWSSMLRYDLGSEADRRRERAAQARERDPNLYGFRHVVLRGPDGLVADEAARRHYFGEDLEVAEAVPERRI